MHEQPLGDKSVHLISAVRSNLDTELVFMQAKVCDLALQK